MTEAMFVVLDGIRPFLDHVVRQHLHPRIVQDVEATLGSAEQCPCGNSNFLDTNATKTPGTCTTKLKSLANALESSCLFVQAHSSLHTSPASFPHC